MVDQFSDLRAIFDRALASRNGLAIQVESEGRAVNMLQKLNRFRLSERKESRMIYPTDHPMFGRSPWDGLALSREGDEVIIRRLSADFLTVREL